MEVTTSKFYEMHMVSMALMNFCVRCLSWAFESCNIFSKSFPRMTMAAMHFFCSVHLVELRGTGMVFAMKAMDKSVMMNRNKVYTMSMNWNFHMSDESRHTYFDVFQSLQVVWQFFCPRRCTEHALKGKSWNLWTTHSFLPFMLRFRFLYSPTSTSIIWLL